MSEKYLLSVREASELYGIGRDRIYELIRSDPGFPVVKIGANYKVNKPLLEAWLDKITIEGKTL